MGGKVKKTEKERDRVTETSHRDREPPGMELPLIPHLYWPLMFLTGEGG